MAIFQLDIADEHVQRVFDAVCGNYRWPAKVSNPEYIVTIEVDEEGEPVLDESGEPIPVYPMDEEGNPIEQNIDNPEDQGEFTHRMVRRFLEDHVSSWEREEAKRIAAEAVDSTVVLSDPDTA